MDSVRDMAAGNYGIRALYAPIQRGKGCFCAAFLCARFQGRGHSPAMEMKKICEMCGKPFTTTRPYKRFCSEGCRRLAYRKRPKPYEEETDGPVLRSFVCARCGRLVNVTSAFDRRKKFCSSHCERLYWKHSGDRKQQKQEGIE